METQKIIYIILLCWAIFICFRVTFKARLKSFLCIGVSMILALVPFVMHSDKMNISFVRIIGEITFYLGVILIVTTERAKLRSIWKNSTIYDWIIGNIPKDIIEEKYSFVSIKERYLFIAASILLIIYSTVDFYFISRDKRTDLILFLMGVVFIFYTLMSWRRNSRGRDGVK